ncbi:MAG: glutamate synthase large subunit [Candidatus Margulisiibacteriota bacterium]
MSINTPHQQGLYNPLNESDACGIGFVAHIKGQKSNDIIKRGLNALVNMAHRGAEGADNKSGDGAGILIQIPHEFFSKQGIDLPAAGEYGTGLVFLPQDIKEVQFCKKELERVLEKEGLQLLGWRKIPVDNSVIGDTARLSEPLIEQVFVEQRSAPGKTINSAAPEIKQESFERKLYVVRKIIEKKIRSSNLDQASAFHMPSFSSRTIVYKGMLQSPQLEEYFLDLQDTRLTSALALVHSRFSTNTFPAWELAQPFRLLAHNGEINTIKGNRSWMRARESQFASSIFSEENVQNILPVIEPDKSDSASLDNALELLVMCGRSLPHALSMLIPESWNEKNPIPDELKAFYEFHSTIMEPWDGPASLVFTDGRFIGGTLDRNGLRPSRYVITNDDMIVMGSEVGVQSFPADKIKAKGRLMPGKILLVDTQEGRIIPDKEVKSILIHKFPYSNWVKENRILLSDIANPKEAQPEMSTLKLRQYQLAFGYNTEDVYNGIAPMAGQGQEPTGSMGTDTPLAVLSEKPQRLFNYFKQLFAQVTNPAIDPIREELVMSLTGYIGTSRNLLAETPKHCKMIKFKNPVFTDSDIEKLKNISEDGFKSAVLSMTFEANTKNEGDTLKKAINSLCREAENLIDSGVNLLILSDRDVADNLAPIPSLLACAAVHHHLIKIQKRTKVSLIIETGEAREVMHFALLFGYGASAVNPYLAFATIKALMGQNKLSEKIDYSTAEYNFIKSINKGLLKVLSKMGTSTLRSYRGTQIFEAIGLAKEVIDEYFTGTDSRISGIGLSEIAREVLIAHNSAYQKAMTEETANKPAAAILPSEGVYRYRKEGEKHAWNPDTIALLQWASRSNDYKKYREFADRVNLENKAPHVLRGLLDFKPGNPIPIEEVEPASEILKRFVTGAMSFGSISKEAHEAMAIAMNKIGGRSNTGEGGEDPARFIPQPDGTSTRSAIKQVASGRFGVTNQYLINADEIQIKISQGAKPGEGGQLPGHKVDKIIAKTRHSTPGVTLISPPPHHDIYSIEDLAQLIFDLKNTNPRARISVKMVSEIGVGTIAAGVAKGFADMILISGYDGGTGASPQSSIKHAGLPWELGLSETQQTLVLNNLRGRVRLQVDGHLKTGRDVVIAAMLGAEEFGFATSALIVLGCVMMRKCHLNTCPVGIATQDEILRKRFLGKAEYLVNYFNFIAQDIREIMAELGIRAFDELVGHSEMLRMTNPDGRDARPCVSTENPQYLKNIKSATVDLSKILYRPESADTNAIHFVTQQIHKIEDIIDHKLIKYAETSLENRKPFSITMPVKNTDRAVGAMLSGTVTRRYGEAGLPEDTIQFTFQGSAGQSFGAFMVKGVTFRLEGDANDYLGKGLSGGKLVVIPPPGTIFAAEENIIVGNTLLYGATSGEAYIRGIAGERFCVRNSGATAVIEGVGDHCCEYMTGGTVVVLGKTGRNFAAGMSGGIAYVFDADGDFSYFCNKGMVELSGVSDHKDLACLKSIIEKHYEYTHSAVAQKLLNSWESYKALFVKVLPFEYKRVLEQKKLDELEAKIAKISKEEQLIDLSDG